MKKFFYARKINFILVLAPEIFLIKKINLAMALIRKYDSSAYRSLSSKLKVIFITYRFGFTNEFFMPEKIWLANKSVIIKNDLPWLASLIIHEAYHATQFRNGKYMKSLPDLEPMALAEQKRFLKKVGDKTDDLARVAISGICPLS